jgi:hypothetical protein
MKTKKSTPIKLRQMLFYCLKFYFALIEIAFKIKILFHIMESHIYEKENIIETNYN